MSYLGQKGPVTQYLSNWASSVSGLQLLGQPLARSLPGASGRSGMEVQGLRLRVQGTDWAWSGGVRVAAHAWCSLKQIDHRASC